MKIGELSKAADVSAHTIRYYEKQGLLHRPTLDGSGHRHYNREDVELLGWIVCLKNSGMSLADIKAYAQAHRFGDAATMTDMLARHLNKLTQQQADIQHYLDVTRRKLERLKNT